MTLRQAHFLIDKYDYLIDRDYLDFFIMSLVIVPANGDHIKEIIQKELKNESYAFYLIDYSEFTIMALMDSDLEKLNENVFKIELSALLAELGIDDNPKEYGFLI